VRESKRGGVGPLLVVAGIASTQAGGAVAKTLFGHLGPATAAFLRVAIAAAILLIIWRPRLRRHSRRELALAALFGLALGGMNLSFYEALDRIPLGIAVTIEFWGPLAVAVAGSRRLLDGVWVAFAAVGIVLLARGGPGVNATGVALAFVAGACWAAYIVLSARVGRAFPAGGGLALAMAVGALALAPVALLAGTPRPLAGRFVAAAAGVALLSSVIPYSLELEALRRIEKRVFGILMSLEPAMAALAGLVILGQGLRTRDVVAIALVVVASLGSATSAGRARRSGGVVALGGGEPAP
jgi:inner membrane transporter RhtA